jgi:hypothetical protein
VFKRLQLAPTQTSWLAAQTLASLARAAVLLAQTSLRDFSVVGAPERRTLPTYAYQQFARWAELEKI